MTEFLIICCRNFNFIFLILSSSILFVSIVLKISFLLIYSTHGILNILLKKHILFCFIFFSSMRNLSGILNIYSINVTYIIKCRQIKRIKLHFFRILFYKDNIKNRSISNIYFHHCLLSLLFPKI